MVLSRRRFARGPAAEVFYLIFQLRVSSRHNALKDARRFPDEQAWQLCQDETLGEILKKKKSRQTSRFLRPQNLRPIGPLA